MQLSNIPRRIVKIWASTAGNSYTRSVPDTGPGGGAAGYDTGFPPQTFQSTSSGGTPPDGRDFNGILSDLTAWAQWKEAGASVPFDATFATAVGGYPNGALVLSTTPGKLWISTSDGNTSNPDAPGATNWLAATASFGVAANSITYADGTIDQWGIVNSSSTGQPAVAMTLATPYTTGSYNIAISPFINGASTTMDTWIQVIRNTITTGGFSVQYQNGSDASRPGLDGFYWRTIGK